MTSIKVGASEGPGSVQPEQVAAKNATTMAMVRAADIRLPSQVWGPSKNQSLAGGAVCLFVLSESLCNGLTTRASKKSQLKSGSPNSMGPMR